MKEYIVIVPMSDKTEFFAAGTVIREDRFSAEKIGEQLRLGLIVPFLVEIPEEAPAKSGKNSAKSSPVTEA